MTQLERYHILSFDPGTKESRVIGTIEAENAPDAMIRAQREGVYSATDPNIYARHESDLVTVPRLRS